MIKINLRGISGINPSNGGIRARLVDIFRKGLEKQKKYDHKGAIAIFDVVLNLDRTFVLAAYEKFWSAVALGDLSMAIKALDFTIRHYNYLILSYKRVEKLKYYSESDIPTLSLLQGFYDTVVLFNALRLLAESKDEGEKFLRKYLSNPLLPQEKKSISMVRSFLMERQEKLKIGNQTIIYLPQECFRLSVLALFTSVAHLFLPAFEQEGDYQALATIISLELKILNQLENGKQKFLKLIQDLQVDLAEVYLEMKDVNSCKKLVLEILAEDPNCHRAALLLDKVNNLVFH